MEKMFWFITAEGNTRAIEDDDSPFNRERKEIGNYFPSREESEKAVEKLKAWTRLRDKGFRFAGWDTNYGHLRVSFIFTKEAREIETETDLDLLFGGKE